MTDRFKKLLTLIIIMCFGSSIIVGLAAAGVFEAKKSGAFEGTEEYYIKKYKLDELKKILVDAIAADTQIVPPEKTFVDFAYDTDAFVEYQMAQAATKDEREATIARSQPHIDAIKKWCAENSTGVKNFKESTTTMITYLDGSQVSAPTFYNTYMKDVSDDAKILMFKICGK